MTPGQELHTGDAVQAEKQLAWSRAYLRREKRRRVLRRSVLMLAVALGCALTVYAAAFGFPQLHVAVPSSSAPSSSSQTALPAVQSSNASGTQSVGGPVRYTVTLDSRGGTEIEPVTGLTAGSLVPRPGDPVREGYAFGGWYKDVARTQPWDFSSDTVEGDTTLYARWVAVPASGSTEGLPQTGVETHAVVWGAVLAGALCLAALAALLLLRTYRRR